MNPEITQTAQQVFTTLQQQQRRLADATTQRLTDLLHECEELRNHELFSVRFGAEINHAAATLILEERAKK